MKDPANNKKLPPLLMTSEAGSFARHTIQKRKPAIIDWILSQNDYTPEIRQSLLDFKDEIHSKPVLSLLERTSDQQLWLRDIKPWLTKTWFELPWFLAETYFYRRILEITGYFQPGPWMEKDPFATMKIQEIDESLAVFIKEYSLMQTENNLANFQNACYKALWGNRGDLSHTDVKEVGLGAQLEDIILDESDKAYQVLQTKPKKIAYFFDNVGKELFFDLALIDWLFENNLAESISGYLKNQPFFVSDATPQDLQITMERMESSSSFPVQDLAVRLREQRKAGKWKIIAPPFFTQAKDFREMPPSLSGQIKTHGLVILKGDANYRRLMGDHHWSPTTTVEEAGGYFPTSFLSLRTLKAELVVGLTKDQFEKISLTAEPDWLINGKRGMITFHQK